MHRVVAAIAVVTLAMAITVGFGAVELRAQGIEVGGSGDRYYLNDEFTTVANVEFSFGRPGDRVYFGDWNGDGVDTPMFRRDSTFQYSNVNATAEPQFSFTYGRADDDVLVGDWNADGIDTLAVRRGALFHVRNTLSDGAADTVIQYGRSDDTVLVGDWDGDGNSTFAVRRGAIYHVRDSMTSGPADLIVQYGREGDLVLVGDWDGDGADSFAVRRNATYFIANEVRPGEADITVVYGRSDDVAFAGDWNGDRRDSLGVRRVAPVPADPVDCTGNGGSSTADPYICQLMDRGVVDVLTLVNEERVAADLAPLSLEPCIAEVAQHWSESMVWLQTTGSAHNPDLNADMRACGVKGWAENVGRTSGDAPDLRQMMDRWLASSAHLENLMRPEMTHIGVGIASGGDRQWYYVLDFGRM